MNRVTRETMRTAPAKFTKPTGIQRTCLDCGRIAGFNHAEILNRCIRARCPECGSTCMGPVPRKRYERKTEVMV